MFQAVMGNPVQGQSYLHALELCCLKLYHFIQAAYLTYLLHTAYLVQAYYFSSAKL